MMAADDSTSGVRSVILCGRSRRVWRFWPVLLALLGPSPLLAQPVEPWTDEAVDREVRQTLGSYGLRLNAEYRSVALGVSPLELQSGSDLVLVEQRLRLGATLDYDEQVALTVSVDGIDGTPWGHHPEASAAVEGARAPTFAAGTTSVEYLGGDPASRESYGVALTPLDTAEVRLAYGELWTDLGMVRVGRQLAFTGTSIASASAEARRNRFGYAGDGDVVDRALFVSKPFELLKDERERDRSEERGVFTFLHYDRLADARATTTFDDVQEVGFGGRWLEPRPDLRQLFDVWAHVSHRWQDRSDTNLTTFALRGVATGYRLSTGIELLASTGRSSIPQRAITLNAIAGDRSIRQFGARGVVRWDEPRFSLYLELDHASADRTFGGDGAFTRFAFSRDTNVGLLLFERVLAFESARSAAVARSLLVNAGADPELSELFATRGAFTSATAVFPQVDLRPLDSLLLRYGVLVAWSPVPVTDPVTSELLPGDRPVNYQGGDPGNFYGVELDARATWSYLDHFFFDLEGALLLPGDALEDANGEADNSYLGQLRATFLF